MMVVMVALFLAHRSLHVPGTLRAIAHASILHSAGALRAVAHAAARSGAAALLHTAACRPASCSAALLAHRHNARHCQCCCKSHNRFIRLHEFPPYLLNIYRVGPCEVSIRQVRQWIVAC